MAITTTIEQGRRAIGSFGTIARLILGIFLILVPVWGPAWWGGEGLQLHEAALGLVGFPAAVLLFQWIRMQFSTERLDATGPLGFFVNLGIAIVLFSIPQTRDAAALFFGASKLLAAARGYAGCEVMAISNWLLRRDDQVGCVVFSPIDAAEARLTSSATSNQVSEA